MTSYLNFVGIDIGKDTFVVSLHNTKTTYTYDNTSEGISLFLSDRQLILPYALCVLEPTGGYELALLYTLCEQHVAVHRADTRKVKNFIRSWGTSAKTDALDAQALARYGQERAHTLDVFTPPSKQAIILFQLVQRRSDIRQMLVAEKNRRHTPSSPVVHASCDVMIKMLQEQMDELVLRIRELVVADATLAAKHKALKSVPGIGDIIAFDLLVLLPEMGTLSRRQVAALAGVAPRACDSGRCQGYRRTGHGRRGVKPMLFLAAMAARNSKSELKVFYEKLIAKGKKKMVALTALMRKILVIANARVRDLDVAKKEVAIMKA